MSKIINSNINNVMYRGAGCDALYHGANLIWRKEVEQPNNIINVTSSKATYYMKNFTGNTSFFITYNSNQDYEVNLNSGYWSVLLTPLFYNSSYSYSSHPEEILHINKFPSVKNFTFIEGVFRKCSNLDEIPKLDISDMCQSIVSVCESCSSIKQVDVSSWDTKNVTMMSGLFEECTVLTEVIGLDSLDTTSLRTFSSIFRNCKSIERIKFPYFNNPIDLSNSLWGCTNLKELDFGENCDVSSSNLEYFFSYAESLTTLKGNIQHIKTNVDAYKSPLTNESALLLINALDNISSTLTITFSKVTYATLSDEQKKIATDKGWTIASA